MATQNPPREGSTSSSSVRSSVCRLEPTPERAEYVSHVFHTFFVDAKPVNHLKLVGPDGVAEDIPIEIYAVLREVFEHLKDGRSISLIPDDALLTTQQAAEILNISRPYFYRLLDADEIPFIKIGTHRKLRLADVVALRERRSNESRKALNAIAALNQECDDYGDDYGETTRE
jgi:excisionase family DNA binding protein